MEHLGMDTEHIGPVPRDRETIGELLGRLAGSSAALVKKEIALFRVEARELTTSVRAVAALMAAAAAVAAVALGTFAAALVMALADRMGAVQAALVVGAGLALVAVLIVAIGLSRLRKARVRHDAHSAHFRRRDG